MFAYLKRFLCKTKGYSCAIGSEKTRASRSIEKQPLGQTAPRVGDHETIQPVSRWETGGPLQSGKTLNEGSGARGPTLFAIGGYVL